MVLIIILFFIIGFILVIHMLRQLSYQKAYLFKNNNLLVKQRMAVILGTVGIVLLLISLIYFR